MRGSNRCGIVMIYKQLLELEKHGDEDCSDGFKPNPHSNCRRIGIEPPPSGDITRTTPFFLFCLRLAVAVLVSRGTMGAMGRTYLARVLEFSPCTSNINRNCSGIDTVVLRVSLPERLESPSSTVFFNAMNPRFYGYS